MKCKWCRNVDVTEEQGICRACLPKSNPLVETVSEEAGYEDCTPVHSKWEEHAAKGIEWRRDEERPLTRLSEMRPQGVFAYCHRCRTEFIDDLPQGFNICCPNGDKDHGCMNYALLRGLSDTELKRVRDAHEKARIMTTALYMANRLVHVTIVVC